MASGDDKAAPKAEHMAAPTSNANAHLTLANGEPSTHGAKRTFPTGLPFPVCTLLPPCSPASFPCFIAREISTRTHGRLRLLLHGERCFRSNLPRFPCKFPLIRELPRETGSLQTAWRANKSVT